MMRITEDLKNDLIALFSKHGIVIEISDQYYKGEELCGQEVEIRSKEFVDGSYPVYIDSMEELSEMIKSGVSASPTPKKDHSEMFKKLENDPELKEAFEVVQETLEGTKP